MDNVIVNANGFDLTEFVCDIDTALNDFIFCFSKIYEHFC